MTPIGIKLTLDGQREVSQGLKQVGQDVTQLQAAGGKIGSLSQGMDKAALSAGQLRMATQQLPLQFQDIVVSLQAGQQPLTVFLQQGSQIAGSFGGAAAAAKAMAGYVLGLVNPLTVAGAAVAGFGLAMASVEKQLRADSTWQVYADATGRGVDLSVDAMKRLRGEMTQLPGVSKSMATSMLGDLVGFRDLSTKAFSDIALVAADVAVLLRTDVPTAAQELAKALVDPARGVEGLNDKLRVLSAQQVATAQAMVDAGNAAGAQAYILEEIKKATQGLASEGLTPLQKATNEFGNAWTVAMDGVGDGSPLQTANELMAGLVRHTADAVRWLGQLKPPVWFEEAAKSGLNGWVYRAIVGQPTPEFTGGASGSWGPNTGGATGSWGPTVVSRPSGGQTDWDREIQDLLKATAGYKTTAQAMADLREQAGKLQEKLQDLRARGEGDSALAHKTQAALDGVNERLANMAKSANSGANATQSSYQTLLSAINQKIVAMREEVSTGEKLTEAEKLRARYQEELLTKGRQFTAQQRERIEAALAALDAEEKQAIAARELAKAHEADAKALERLTAQRERSLATLRQSVIAAQDEERAAAMAAASNISHAEAVARLAYARADDLYQQALANGEAPQTLYFLEQERQARQRLVEVMSQRTVREANDKAAKEAARAWDKVSRTIGDTLADYIMAGGKDAATYLKRLFSTLVLQPVVQAGVGAVLGVGVAGASGVAAGGAGGIANLVQQAYSAFTSPMFTNFGMGLAGNIQQLGGTLFSKGFEALGSNIVSFGNTVAQFSGAINMAGKIFGYGSALYSLSKGNYGSAIGTAAGTLLGGPIGAVLGSTLGGLLDGLFGGGRGANHSGGAYSTKGGNAAYQLGLGGDALRDFTSRGNASIANSVKGLVTTTVGAFDYLKKFNESYKGVDVAAGFAVNPRYGDEDAYGYFRVLDKVTGQLLSNYVRRDGGLGSDTTKAWSTYSADLIKAVYKQFKAGDLTGWVQDELAVLDSAASLENLTAAVQAIAVIDAAFADFAKTIDGMSGLSGAVQTVLLRTSGGIEALSANVATYYQAFYSEQERAAKTAGQMAEALKAYGVELPTTAEQYRKLVEQQLAAGESGAELAAVLLSMSGTFKEVADVLQREMDGLVGSVTGFFSGLKDSIHSLLDDVSDDRKSILRGVGVMTAEDLRAAIGAISTVGPSLAGVDAGATGVATAEQKVSARQSQSAAAQASLLGAKKARDAANASRDSVSAQIKTLDSKIASLQQTANSRGFFNRAARRQAQQQLPGVIAERARLQAQLQVLSAQAAAQQSAYDAVAKAASGAAQQLAQAQQELAKAQEAEQKAKAAYAAEMAKWVEEAGVSVGKLSDLRGEVMSFYEAQAQAVQAMLASAGNIRAVVDAVRLNQLSAAQTAQELGARYAMDYSMALATTGTVRAGYVDRMAGNLGALSEAMRAEAATGEEWRVQTARLLAQASNVAGLLEGDAEGTDYQEIALDLLGDIDAKLAELSGVATSGEGLIVEAIKAGTASNMEGLRAIVAALKGETIPTFATGGWHAGGLRIVGERGPELEVTGPSRIWNHQQLQSMLGSGGNADEVRALRAELQQQRQESQAHAMAMLDVMELVQRVLNRWDLQGMPEERPAQVVQA
ncbi:phage tail length tape measure family protein [Comamonas kerstersii]|uniref:phage tail length tape measure family protein n=1 Tax=Comamonas kerstersii TaxID=225992 RepID=UPI001B33AFBE|nr:phage tail length tape measure family protein [Comamonas kerstersii]QTW18183.1 phage tail length tape measure family protein [Comamonas kerstersii]